MSSPATCFGLLGEAGVLGMPYPEEFGGAGQPYEVYLQALEEIAPAWMSVGVGVSVHVMTCFALFRFGTAEQRAALLPAMLGGQLLGAYALSEAQAGSDIAGMTTRAKTADEGYALTGAKAWITHGRRPTSTPPSSAPATTGPGLSCFLVPGDAPGLSFGAPEHKMGLTSSPTTSLYFDTVPVDEDRRIGVEGEGMPIALAALDSGRLGIAACATGLAQAALDWRSPTPRNGSSSAGRSRSSRGWSSCWPRWPPRSTPPGPLLMAARKRDAAGRSPGTPRSRR